MKTFRITFALSLCLLLAGIFAGCADKSHVRRRGDGTITLVLQAPAMESGNAMRQMSADNESAVSADKLYVLVFKTTGANGAPLDEPEEQYAYTAKVASVTPMAKKKQYEAKIRLKPDDGTTRYRLVLITNCDFDLTALSVGMTKTQVFALESLKKAFDGKWPTDENARIPMWGESNTQRITEDVTFGDCKDTSSSNRIHLVRSLARVDVGLNFGADFNSETPNPTPQTPFKLKSVNVYRMAKSFTIPGTQSNTFHKEGNEEKPIPVLPNGVTMQADANPLEYSLTDESATVREIYIPERLKGTNRNDRPCIVIGGVYGSDTKTTYYRLDFIKKPTPTSPKDQAEPLDILRNHRYRFNITKVTGPGSDTPGDALLTEPVNIAFDVVVWNDGEIGEVRYDGQYYLAVNKDKFEFGRSESDEPFTIRTNWEDGYKFVDAKGDPLPKTKAEAEAKHMWYYLSDPKDPAFVKDKNSDEKVFVLENTTGAARTSADNTIYVQAGRIKWPLKINQSNKIAVYIRLYEQVGEQRIPTHLVEMTKGETKTVEVEYTPGANLERRETDAGSQIWTRKDDGSVSGKAVYEITPDESRIDENTFNHIAVSRFVADLEGATASADLTVTLTNYNAIPYRDKTLTVNMLKGEGNSYLLDDNNQFFFIKANAPYKVEVLDITTAPINKPNYQKKVVRGWDSWPKTVFTQDAGHLTGDKHVFMPYDYVAGSDGSHKGDVRSAIVRLKITPTDNNKHFDEKEFTISFFSGIIQPTANCYIIKKGSTIPILIPVSEQINKAAEWYAEYKEVMEGTVEHRKTYSGVDVNGISSGAYNNYVSENKSNLDRLEANEDNWEVGFLWSTISSSGTTPGITCEKVQIDGYRQRNYMSVKLENPNSNDIGSAIVVVKRKNGTILWSWHIWVVDNYPWEPLRPELASPLPFMNRNLGARYQNTNKSPIYDPNQAGMYYQFGRKDPFHPYDQVPSPSVKVYKSGPDANQKNQAIILGMASIKAFWRMRDFVRNPTAMGFRDDQFTNALEWGPWEFRNEMGNKIWQGFANTSTMEPAKRAIYPHGTDKTPFDPSPYGWKVPAVGLESNFAASPGFYPAASGCFPKGDSKALTNEYSAYSVSTRINVRDINPGIRYDYSTNGMNYDMLQGANPSAAIPVRCRLNEKEADYKRYTEGGFYLENKKRKK